MVNGRSRSRWYRGQQTITVRTPSLAAYAVPGREGHGARNNEDIGVAQRRREYGIRGGHGEDFPRRFVEDRDSRRAVDLNVFDGPIGADRYGESKRAVAALGGFGIIEIADAF